MPFLRFSRDKRGYEITSLVEVYRRRGKTRSRILYWFRTPPNVKVGRAPLDPECIRAIEEHHPDLEFDWPSIFEARPEEAAEPRGEAGGRGRAGRGGEATPGVGRRERRRADIGPVGVERRAGRSERPPAAVARPGRVAEETPAEAGPPGPPAEPRTSGESEPAEASAVPVESAPVGELNGEDDARPVMAVSPEEVLEVGPVMPPAPEPPPSSTSAALEMMSAESLARLRARYAEILARLSERISDPVELERWRLQAEKLNPDAWVTPEEVRQGLEEYETAYAGLRTVVGSRRRRSRRGGARRRRRGPSPETTGVSAGEGEAGAVEQGEPADEGGQEDEGGFDDDLPEGDDPDED